MAAIYNAVPPGDGLLEYYGWGRLADGPTLIHFFNSLASSYGDLGFQDRLLVSGTNIDATFTFCFAERGNTTDLPVIFCSVARQFNSENPITKTALVPRPALEEDETYADMTYRWLCEAFSELKLLNTELEAGFVFGECPPAVPGTVTPVVTPAVAPYSRPSFPLIIDQWLNVVPGATQWVSEASNQLSWTDGLATTKGLLLTSLADPFPALGQQYIAVQYRIKDWSNAVPLIDAGADDRSHPFVFISTNSDLPQLFSASAWIEAITFFGALTPTEIETIRNNPV